MQPVGIWVAWYPTKAAPGVYVAACLQVTEANRLNPNALYGAGTCIFPSASSNVLEQELMQSGIIE